MWKEFQGLSGDPLTDGHERHIRHHERPISGDDAEANP